MNSLVDRIDFPPDTFFYHFTIEVLNDWTEVVYNEKEQHVYSYIFQKGDTVLININERRPWMEVINRTTKEYDVNWEVMKNRNLLKRNQTGLEDFYFLWNSSINSFIDVNMKGELLKAKVKANNELSREKDWIDSLVNEGLLSKSYANLFSERNRFENYKIGFFDIRNGSFDAVNAIQHFLSDSTFEKGHIYVNEYADFLLTQLINQHQDNTDEIIDDASKSYFSQLLLYKILKWQLNKLSFAEIDRLLAENASKLPAEWNSELRKPIEKLLIQDTDMELKGIGEKMLGFDEVLDQKIGMYVYVDLWAAWCIPCIRSFPESRSLQDEYHNKGLEVVYLSVDKNHKFWEEVIQKYDIAFPDRSYIVMNIDESAYLKEINVELIPRYILFDPQGNLIHPNAPRPESKEIRVLLDSLTSD
ncbi:TlpA family protein disulfide reductase [Algoriphagus pacificus]|uniref:Redoxin family protein n=1 Tax=Algoriphagus pacificus TaxID=2811234 RepID=A0ABS3CLR3_9BACT|nr:TlpA disulfide reductase family protein [Algoriphagus pacificus]MBN7818038.1 redoxin family protein [Algoriphagus pacificus]